MRDADRTEEREQGRGTLTIEVWNEPCEEAWDGCEPLPEDAEVWDIYVRVTGAGGWSGTAQLASNAFVPDADGNAWFRDQVEEVVQEAIANLEIELDRAAAGFGVEDARRRRDDARKAQRMMFPSRSKAFRRA